MELTPKQVREGQEKAERGLPDSLEDVEVVLRIVLLLDGEKFGVVGAEERGLPIIFHIVGLRARGIKVSPGFLQKEGDHWIEEETYLRVVASSTCSRNAA